jgi:hypothetical protein
MVKFRSKPENAERLIVRNRGILVKFREKTANVVELNVRNDENKKWSNLSCLLADFRQFHFASQNKHEGHKFLRGSVI